MHCVKWLVVALWIVGVWPVVAAETPSLHDRWHALEVAAREEFKKYPAPFPSRVDEAAYRKPKESDAAAGAYRQRLTANFKELLAEGLARGEDASFEEHLALSVMAATLNQFKEARRQAEAANSAQPDDPRGLLILLVAQLRDKEFDAAEKTLAKVPEGAPLPDVNWTHSFLNLSHNLFRGSRRPEAISRSERWLLDAKRAAKPDTALMCFTSFITINLASGQGVHDGWGELALADVLREQRAWEALASPFSPWIAQRLSTLRIEHLIKLGRQDEARTLLTAALGEVRQVRRDSPNDANACLHEIALERAAHDLLPPEEQLAARQKWAESLHTAIRHFPTETMALEFGQGTALYIFDLVRQGEYETAATAKTKLLETLRALPETLQTSPVLGLAYRMGFQPAAELERPLARNQLAGKPAPPLEAGAWVNGQPLAPRDLEGKVVLVDFWATWCQPCLRALPHLAGWQRKFADQGLLVVGVTKYYNQDWDAENSRPTRVDNLSDEDERAALVKFASHHELPFAIAFDAEDSRLSNRFGVEGIPQLVLIDRKGIVRLVHVGFGAAGAAEITKKIEELLAE